MVAKLKGSPKSNNKKEFERIIQDIINPPLKNPKTGGYAGAGAETVKQGRAHSKRGKTPEMGVTPKDTSVIKKHLRGNITEDDASKKSRLETEKRRKRAIRTAASKKGGKIMIGYKAGGKV